MLSTRTTYTESNKPIKVITVEQGAQLLGQKYLLSEFLGEGRTSQVRKVHRLDDDGTYAAKLHFQPTQQDVICLNQEVKVLQQVPKHKNIIQLHKFYEEGPIYEVESQQSLKKKAKAYGIIILEFAEKGTLIDHLLAKGRLEMNQAKKTFQQIAEGLKHLHTNGVCHLDLKPDNLLLDEHFEIKLADFGLSAFQETPDQHFSHKVGTDAYQPPEVRAASIDRPYSGQKADIFSLGVTLFAMVKGYPPFTRAVSEDPFYYKLEQNDWSSFWQMHYATDRMQLPQSFKDLIQGMLAPVPDFRNSLEEILESKWLRTVTSE